MNTAYKIAITLVVCFFLIAFMKMAVDMTLTIIDVFLSDGLSWRTATITLALTSMFISVWRSTSVTKHYTLEIKEEDEDEATS